MKIRVTQSQAKELPEPGRDWKDPSQAPSEGAGTLPHLDFEPLTSRTERQRLWLLKPLNLPYLLQGATHGMRQGLAWHCSQGRGGPGDKNL